MYVSFQFKYRLLFNKARKGGVKKVKMKREQKYVVQYICCWVKKKVN